MISACLQKSTLPHIANVAYATISATFVGATAFNLPFLWQNEFSIVDIFMAASQNLILISAPVLPHHNAYTNSEVWLTSQLPKRASVIVIVASLLNDTAPTQQQRCCNWTQQPPRLTLIYDNLIFSNSGIRLTDRGDIGPHSMNEYWECNWESVQDWEWDRDWERPVICFCYYL